VSYAVEAPRSVFNRQGRTIICSHRGIGMWESFSCNLMFGLAKRILMFPVGFGVGFRARPFVIYGWSSESRGRYTGVRYGKTTMFFFHALAVLFMRCNPNFNWESVCLLLCSSVRIFHLDWRTLYIRRMMKSCV
jgi:hypothetical protein